MNKGGTAPTFLSRLILDTRSRRVRSELADPYEMHRTLMRAFPAVTDGESAREQHGVLFRADADDHRAIVYVQSRVEPDWSFLGACPGYLSASTGVMNPASKDITTAIDRLREGQALRFVLRANPTKRIAKPTKGDSDLKGKRVALLTEQEHIEWLVRKGREREKGKSGGFEIVMMDEPIGLGREAGPVPSLVVRPEGMRKGRKREHKMNHFAVRFEGLLRITDADAFRDTIVRGIGSAKAFGFGLVSLAPAAIKGAGEDR
jgi:CRISPR system Cascade subunit CasE